MSRSPRSSAAGDSPVVLTGAVLRNWPLPAPDTGGDKEARGRVLVVGGAPEMPGALLLAGEGALRAGAGKLQMATPRSVALPVGVALPEGRVFALPETEAGGIADTGAEQIADRGNRADAVLLGPGMVDETAVSALLKRLLPRLDTPVVVLDAAALSPLAADPDLARALKGRAVLTPHAGEMAMLLGVDKDTVNADPLATARDAAERFGAVIALKGAETFIVAPDGQAYHNRSGNVGLGTSGSGDTLAGIIAGLAARGAGPLQAAAWGVSLHARAGDRLARRQGRLGYLAREILAEVPALVEQLSPRKK